VAEFTHRTTKDGKVLISWRGRVVTTLAGERARALARRADGADAAGVQELLRRATGNFRHGNERR
jgi:hypothetical protein